MLSLKQPAVIAILAAAVAAAQPALSTVQDTLYRANGSRFSGTVYITWSSFVSGEGANIATANLTVPVVNGALRVQLVPTTTASAGARYNVRYNSKGINDFTEVWAVPPSSVTLRIRDVRVSTGVVVGPPPVITPIQIPDVVGLPNELALRPPKGVGFGVGRTAVINSAGQIDAAVGNLSDCVRVDGSGGACGSGGGGILPSFADGEIPAGPINGSNLVFTLGFTPSPAASLGLYRNGLLAKLGVDYSLEGKTITFSATAVPKTGDSLLAAYRYANPSSPLSSLTPAQVVCSTSGSSVSTATSTSLATCTIPSGLLGTGDRIGVEFQYEHTGTSAGFTSEVRIGPVTVLLRSAASSETLLVGRTSLGLFSPGQVWEVQSWGTGTAFATGAGTSALDITLPLTVDLRGQLAVGGADALALRNFTVVRYPAQSNP
jgi:hypothetical protein